jgi:hypothetical protein
MGFLRRLLGGADADVEAKASDKSADAPGAEPPPATSVDGDAAERAYEAALLRDEQARLDELVQRQLRYADYAWQPPAEGGTRRADDGDGDRE